MKQKTGRKMLSFLFTLAMVIGLLSGMSMTALADNKPIESKPEMFVNTAYNPGFTMSFSNYEYDSYSDEYYLQNLENFVDWYVIDFQQGANQYDKGTVTLLAEKPQTLAAFDENNDTVFLRSSIKTELDRYVDPDPDNPSFFGQFADAIIDTDTDKDGKGDSKLYLLSMDDLDRMQRTCPMDLGQFLSFKPTEGSNTDQMLTNFNYYERVWWVLENPGAINYYDSEQGRFADRMHAFPVGEDNGETIFDKHEIKPTDQLGLRPAMKIDLNKVSYRPTVPESDQNVQSSGIFYIVPVTDIELNKTEKQEVSVDQAVQFQSRLTGCDYGFGMEAPSDTTVKWSVVGEDGKVTDSVKLYLDENCKNDVGTDAIPCQVPVYAKGESEGSVKVRVTSNADSTKYAECSVKVEPAGHSVTLTGGANATISGGDATQTELTGEMTAVTYTAEKGYYFEDFTDITKNGIAAKKTSDTQVTVSGTPTADAAITIPDAKAKSTYSPYEMNSDKPVKLNGIDWYVIKDESTAADAGTVTLLAKDAVGSSRFNPKGADNAYKGSEIQKYVDELAETGSLSNFYDAMIPVDLPDVKVEKAKLYLLSADDVNSLERSIIKCIWGNQNNGWKNIWYTRSPGYEGAAMCAADDPHASNTAVQNVCGVRPAFCLDLSKVDFNSETREFTLKPSDSGYYVKIFGSEFAEASPSEGTTQTGLTGEMTQVTYTVNRNYHFEPFDDITKNGITVKRKSESEITVSGTPTANTRIKLPDPVTIFPVYVNNPDKTVKFNGIEWYVIADNSTVKGDGTLTLLTKYPISRSKFNRYKYETKNDNAYSISAIRKELDEKTFGIKAPTLKTYGQTGEGISAEATVPAGNFMTVADAIVPTDLEDVGVTDAKLYLLSLSEAQALKKDIIRCTWADGTPSSQLDRWFLRTPSYNEMVDAMISSSGGWSSEYVDKAQGIRPALRLDLSKVEFDAETQTFEHKEGKIGEIKYYKATKSEDTYTKTGDALGEAPTNAGNYVAEVTVTFGEDKETASVGYTIAKAEPVFNPPTDLTATYGQTLGDVPLTNQEGNTPGKWTWYLGNNTSVGNAGIRKFYAVFNPDDTVNYNNGKFKQLTVTVNRANAVAATVTANNSTYDGTDKPLVNEDDSTLAGGEMWYAIGDDDKIAPEFDGLSDVTDKKWSTSIPTATEVGTYYVWYKVVGDENHNDTEPEKVTAKIDPVDKTSLETRITEAESFYETISEDDKNKSIADALKAAIDKAKEVYGVNNKTEAEIAEAAKALEEALDEAKAGVVTVLIDKLPSADKVTTSDKAAVEEARKAYDALTDEQKAKVPAEAVKKLEDDEKALKNAEAKDKEAKELKAAQKEAQAAMNLEIVVTQKGKKIAVKWNRSKAADGYDVYVQYCSKKFKKPVKKIKKNTVRKVKIKKINGKKIKLKKQFKVYVAAYKIVDGKKVVLAKSNIGHVVGVKNKKYTNVKTIKLKKKNYIVKAGQTRKIKAKIKLVNKHKRHIPKSHAPKFRYRTSDNSIATVNKKGKIKGIKPGKCTIYVYAINGKMKKATVVVR